MLMTRDNLTKMGYEYDYVMRSWYSKTDIAHKFAFPPFGLTDKMLADGLTFEIDETGKLKSFSFGKCGCPKELQYLGEGVRIQNY